MLETKCSNVQILFHIWIHLHRKHIPRHGLSRSKAKVILSFLMCISALYAICLVHLGALAEYLWNKRYWKDYLHVQFLLKLRFAHTALSTWVWFKLDVLVKTPSITACHIYPLEQLRSNTEVSALLGKLWLQSSSEKDPAKCGPGMTPTSHLLLLWKPLPHKQPQSIERWKNSCKYPSLVVTQDPSCIYKSITHHCV